MYTVREVTNKDEWESLTCSTLLQTWEWGNFYQALGKKVWRIGVYKDDKLVCTAQAVHIDSRLRSHLYIANGPVCADGEPLQEVIREVIAYCKRNQLIKNCHFIRIEPLLEPNPELAKTLEALHFVKASTYVQPERTIIIDLSKSEDELKQELDHTTRYRIKKGLAEGIQVTSSTEDADFDKFWPLYEKISRLQQFVISPKSYYLAQFHALRETGKYKVFLAYDKNDLVGGALVGYDKYTGYYLHAARNDLETSTSKHSPRVLMWEALLDAKKQGYKYFNLYGIACDDTNTEDPWYGFTTVKKGFGGTTIQYIGAYDYPLTTQYWVIRWLERNRRAWGYPYYLLKKLLGKKQVVQKSEA